MELLTSSGLQKPLLTKFRLAKATAEIKIDCCFVMQLVHNMAVFYTVVYGPEWEDIAYFADLNKAKVKALVQTLGSTRTGGTFYPFIQTWTCDEQGVFRQDKHIVHAAPSLLKHVIEKHGMAALRADPTLALDTMVECS